ncbi:hypothetical protein [Rhizobium leguminosarum]|uniref:hypothetical protein n=1 Tax=Rhizobium leguminosarum TaxID=384 RepID=UPI00160D09F0|nr:hypothetical protein [Rhizobium leguminosarum]MBB4345117.1 hypothetical protein [Rhizobium leguminosarum]MBB6298188.1 hypothetical protein [Rhizobium leguminosarum]
MPAKTNDYRPYPKRDDQFSHAVGRTYVKKFEDTFNMLAKASESRITKVDIARKLINKFHEDPSIISDVKVVPTPQLPQIHIGDDFTRRARFAGVIDIHTGLGPNNLLGVPVERLREATQLYLYFPNIGPRVDRDEFESLILSRLDDPEKTTALFTQHDSLSRPDTVMFSGDHRKAVTRFIMTLAQRPIKASLIVASANPPLEPFIIADDLVFQGIAGDAVAGQWEKESMLGQHVQSEFQWFFSNSDAVCWVSNLSEGASWPRKWRDAASSPRWQMLATHYQD